MAERLVPELESLGARVEVDDVGSRIGGDVGNVLARVPASAPGREPLLLCAHMDTVIPCETVRPVLDGTVIRTDGTSVLGGDDKAAIVAILEALRDVRERGVAHGPIEVLFTVSEESGLLGAKHFDAAALTARRGLVLDCDGVDELIIRAPAACSFRATVHGLEAHAGMFPEQGISAVQVAAEAIAAMRLGRVDGETRIAPPVGMRARSWPGVTSSPSPTDRMAPTGSEYDFATAPFALSTEIAGFKSDPFEVERQSMITFEEMPVASSNSSRTDTPSITSSNFTLPATSVRMGVA